MTYTLTLCLGMLLSLCGHIRTFEFPTKQECEEARSKINPKSIGDGYAVCAPTKKELT